MAVAQRSIKIVHLRSTDIKQYSHFNHENMFFADCQHELVFVLSLFL